MHNESKTVMVSACLLGVKCRYDGNDKKVAGIDEQLKEFRVIPFCPEALGGLPIPRLPAEITDGDGEGVWNETARVLNQEGLDISNEFRNGAQKAFEIFEKEQPEMVIFKAHSPSCGMGRIYDGSFKHTLRDGDGVTAALLRKAGARMITEEDLRENKFWKDKF